jgi:thymidine phosphorylase
VSAGPDLPLAVVHATSEAAWQKAAAALRLAIEIGPEPPVVDPVVCAKVIGGAHDETT